MISKVETRNTTTNFFESSQLENLHTENSFFSDRLVTHIIDAVTWIPRFLFAAVRFLPVLIFIGVGCLYFRSDIFEPKGIVNGNTPIILIPGSCSNKRSWDILRPFFQGENTGHVFAINLNDHPVVNDPKTISEYAEVRLARKIEDLKEQYFNSGYVLDEVILIGHSMGGLVAADYAVNQEENTGVKVKALGSLSTPWNGSSIADLLYTDDLVPQKEFLTTSKSRIALKNKLLEKSRQGDLSLYTFSSTFDPIVRPHSSELPVASENKILSKHHDHSSLMADPFLAQTIRRDWIEPNTKALSVLKA